MSCAPPRPLRTACRERLKHRCAAWWADNPKSSHSHIEVWKTLGGGYNVSNMLDPIEVFGGIAPKGQGAANLSELYARGGGLSAELPVPRLELGR